MYRYYCPSRAAWGCWDAWRYQQEMSAGDCEISLDRHSVSKEFQSRIVLGKNEYLYISVRAACSHLGGAVVERWTRDRKVAGSTPGRGAIKSTRSTQPSIPPG